jgi:hypothetical protein
MLIGLLGEKESGKDTAADYIAITYNFRKERHARPVKDTAKAIFGFTDEQVDGSLKETIDPRWNITPRTAMQFVGTVFRDHINQILPGINNDIWIKSLHLRNQGTSDNIIIADVRYQNEVDAIKQLGGTVIRLIRNTNNMDMHPSEAGVAQVTGFDYVIYNTGSKLELYRQLDDIINRVR